MGAFKIKSSDWKMFKKIEFLVCGNTIQMSNIYDNENVINLFDNRKEFTNIKAGIFSPDIVTNGSYSKF